MTLLISFCRAARSSGDCGLLESTDPIAPSRARGVSAKGCERANFGNTTHSSELPTTPILELLVQSSEDHHDSARDFSPRRAGARWRQPRRGGGLGGLLPRPAMQLGAPALQRGDAPANDEAAGSVVNVTALLRTSVPSLMLRGERHTGTNFLDAIIQHNFRREPQHQRAVAALAAPLRARKCYNFFGVSAPCYMPHGPFSGCITQCSDPTLNQCASPSDRSRTDSASALRPSSYCCWKHGALDPTCRYTPRVSAYVIAVREPYAWLAAMYREPYEYRGSRKLGFAEFLRRPYAEKPPYYLHRTRHADPVAIWAKCVRSYFALPPAARLFVHIDDLFDLVRLGSQLSPLLLRMGFVRRPGLTALVYPPWATELTKYNKYWERFHHAGCLCAREAPAEQSLVGVAVHAGGPRLHQRSHPREAARQPRHATGPQPRRAPRAQRVAAEPDVSTEVACGLMVCLR